MNLDEFLDFFEYKYVKDNMTKKYLVYDNYNQDQRVFNNTNEILKYFTPYFISNVSNMLGEEIGSVQDGINVCKTYNNDGELDYYIRFFKVLKGDIKIVG